jgi:hypothetical protein
LLPEWSFQPGDRCNVSDVTAYEIPPAGSAEARLLRNGYVGLDGDDERVNGTVAMVIGPGAVTAAALGVAAPREALPAALRSRGPAPEDAGAPFRPGNQD